MKKNICKHCGAINKHFSFQCRLKETKKKENKPKKPISKFSDKKLQELKEYRKERDKYIKENTICEAKLSNCTHIATDIHHKAGRIGKLLCDTKYFISLCRSCHSFIEVNPKFAKEQGFSVNRLDK